MTCEPRTFIIKQIVFTTARLNYKISCPCHCRNLICIETCCIYQALCLNVALSGMNHKATVSTLFNSMNFSFAEEKSFPAGSA